jgi:hypothetical protein
MTLIGTDTMPPIDYLQKHEPEWLKDMTRHQWVLPPAAPWIIRIPVIRHVRHLILAVGLVHHQSVWSGMAASGYDEWALYAIRHGWC